MDYLEYELMVKEMLEKRLHEQNHRVDIQHQKAFISLSSNRYNIDLSYETTMIVFKYLTIIECKYWDSHVSREKVGYVKTIIHDLKAQKGIVITSRGFQSGAIQFAKGNNIGLLRITNTKKVEMISHYDGGMYEIEESLKSDQEVSFKKQIRFTGLFGTYMPILDFIAKFYGAKLAGFLRDEYSPAMLDITDLELDPQVEFELSKLPDDWNEMYVKMETAGLCYAVANAAELRVLSLQISLLKAQLKI